MARAVPEGHHSLTAHLMVRGGAQAIEFYKRAFGAEECVRSEGPGGAVMHAELQLGDSKFFVADAMPGGPPSPLALKGSPVVINYYLEGVDALWQRAVAAGATVVMPLADQFWGDRYGQLRDPFGHLWALGQHMEDLTPEETNRRAEEFFASMPPPSRPARKKPSRAKAKKKAKKK